MNVPTNTKGWMPYGDIGTVGDLETFLTTTLAY